MRLDLTPGVTEEPRQISTRKLIFSRSRIVAAFGGALLAGCSGGDFLNQIVRDKFAKVFLSIFCACGGPIDWTGTKRHVDIPESFRGPEA